MLIVAAAALHDGHRRVLVQRRPAGHPLAGLWEFPGGKIEPGETPEQALVRELAEELGIDVACDDLQPFSFTSATTGVSELLLLLFNCNRWSGDPVPIHADQLAWVDIADLGLLDMPPADNPLVEALQSRV